MSRRRAGSRCSSVCNIFPNGGLLKQKRYMSRVAIALARSLPGGISVLRRQLRTSSPLRSKQGNRVAGTEAATTRTIITPKSSIVFDLAMIPA
jgi:hypothetical protein